MNPAGVPFSVNLPPHLQHLLQPSPAQPYARDLSLVLDSKIAGLQSIYNNFGRRAVEAIMLGLSRPFHATSEDVAALIGQWERRDAQCCYQGSIHDLFKMTDTLVLAISYKHEEDRELWRRKGEGRTCKFQDCDESLFTAAVKGLSHKYPKVMVWCDQILSSRLKHDETNFTWFQIGLLPYAAFRVLNLSTSFSAEELERRIWIKAERSLGRMGYGFFNADDLSNGIVTGSSGQGKIGWECMQNLCKHILSGYWPEELGYWKDDYRLMKMWALGLLCRGAHHYFDLPFFQDHEFPDNTEIISNMGELGIIPDMTEDAEPVKFTNDKLFFLKATAWNLSVKHIWEESPAYISHYMGRIENAKFSWWHSKQVNILFGCLTCKARATISIAVETKNGYHVIKRAGDFFSYVHAERTAGPKTRKHIMEAAKRAGIDLYPDLEWKLLYCSDGDDSSDISTRSEVAKELKNQMPDAVKTAGSAVVVPPVFRGSTTNLFKWATEGFGGNATAVAHRMIESVKDWNEYVRNTYLEWIAVKDTTIGPVWLEGFDDRGVSFGFLEFLTTNLLMNERCVPRKVSRLVEPWDVEQEVYTMRGRMESNERCLAEEFVKDVDACDSSELLTKRDVARYMLSGGFSNEFGQRGLTGFLCQTALAKGYWLTQIVCWDGVMQIRFTNASGEKRIAQRETRLANYTGRGVVDPKDYEKVKQISLPYNTSDVTHLQMSYWNYYITDTTTRENMWQVLHNSKRFHEGKQILLTDMTVGEMEEDRLLGEANDFAHSSNPFRMMALSRSGQAAEMFGMFERREALQRIRHAEHVSGVQGSMDRQRELERRLLEEQEPEQPQDSQSPGPEP